MANVASNLFSSPSKTPSPSSLFGSPAQNALTKVQGTSTSSFSPYLPSAAKLPAIPIGGMKTTTPMSTYTAPKPAGVAQPATAAPPTSANTTTQSVTGTNGPLTSFSSFGGGNTYTPPTPTAAPATQQSSQFSGLVGNIGSSAQGLGTQAGLINNTAGLIGSQGQMTPEEEAARAKLAALPGVQGAVNSNIEQHPSDMAFQMGREAVAGRNIESQRQSLADQISAYAAERAANTTAFQGQATAQNQAGSLLNSGGQLQASAANLAQPQLGAYGQNYYNPLEPGGGQGGDITSAISQYAEGLKNGTIPYSSIPSSITGNSILNAQLLQSAGGGNFNLNTSLGSSAAQQSNTTLSGTAVQGANAGVYQQALPAYYQMQSQLQNVEGLGGLLLTTATGGQINPFAPQFANMTVAQLRSQLSSPEQTKFNSTLAAFQGAASQLLANSSGQIPTDISKNISLLASGNLQLGALKAMVDQAQKEGGVKLTNQAAIVNSALQNVQQGSNPQSSPGSTGGSGFGWSG